MLQLAHQIVDTGVPPLLAKGLVEYCSPNGRLGPVVNGDCFRYISKINDRVESRLKIKISVT